MKKPARACCLSILFFLISVSAALYASAADVAGSDVALRSVNGYLMVVGVSLNGSGPFDFLVDTGTNTTLIDPDLATELNLKPVDSLALTTLSDATRVTRYYADNMRIGKASVAHLELLGAPLTELRSLDKGIRGVLGMNFLLQFSFLLDYRHHRFQIFPFPDSAPAPQGQRIKIRIHDSRILVRVSSESAVRGAWNLVLDSGIAGFLVFKSRTRLPEPPCQATPCIMKVSTNGGNHNAGSALVPEAVIAGNRIFNQPMVVLTNDLLNPADPQDGLIPASFFRSLFFDRSNGSLVVEAK